MSLLPRTLSRWRRQQYGFPYDDYAGPSSDISVTNPQYAVVAVGW